MQAVRSKRLAGNKRVVLPGARASGPVDANEVIEVTLWLRPRVLHGRESYDRAMAGPLPACPVSFAF